MKAKMFFSLMIAALLSLQVVRASDKSEVSGKNESLNDVRSKLIPVLNRVIFSGEGGTVNIFISRDNSKNVLVYKVEGSDKELVSAVKDEISSLKLQAPENFAGKFMMKVRFVDALSNNDGLVASE